MCAWAGRNLFVCGDVDIDVLPLVEAGGGPKSGLLVQDSVTRVTPAVLQQEGSRVVCKRDRRGGVLLLTINDLFA